MDWKSIVGTVAPGLATALGGPLAGMAVSAITRGLGLSDDAGEAEIDMAMRSATPETLAKLKEIDAKFKTDMKALDIDLEKIAAADRDSARSMQTTTRSRMPAFIALVALTGFFGILICMIFVTLPAASEAPLQIMLGVLGTLVVGISNFYFGSSQGSKDKTALLSPKV